MSKDDKLVKKHILKNLAYYVSQGYSVENAAYKTDIDPVYALELTSDREWEKTLGEISPEALKVWKEAKEDQSIEVHVRSQAKKDGPMLYKMFLDAVKALDPKDQVPGLEKLLRLGGYFDKEETRETITLSPSSIMAVNTAKKEMDFSPEDIRSPYDA